MKCDLHDCELEYAGENIFGDDIWTCPMCEAELDAQYDDAWEYYDEQYQDGDNAAPFEGFSDNVIYFGWDEDDEL